MGIANRDSLTGDRWFESISLQRRVRSEPALWRSASPYLTPARRAHFAELHRIVQDWILTFRDNGALDAQLDEAKIAFGEVRTLNRLSETEWAGYWGAVQEVSDRNGGTYRLPGRPWHFSRDELAPLGDPAFQGEHNRDVCATAHFPKPSGPALRQRAAHRPTAR
jgi:crotonobetainyl-CoA:carnitine CoA-transferase CaiB-like acyl-CoA transferase